MNPDFRIKKIKAKAGEVLTEIEWGSTILQITKQWNNVGTTNLGADLSNRVEHQKRNQTAEKSL